MKRRNRAKTGSIDVMATDILHHPHVLAIVLGLAKQPKRLSEITGLKYYVRSKRGISEKNVYLQIAVLTLKKLVKLGYVERLRGMDKRTRYYKLTGKGEELLSTLMRIIKDKIKYKLKSPEKLGLMDKTEYKGYRGLPEEEFRELIIKTFGVDPELLIDVYGIKREELKYSTGSYGLSRTEAFILIDYTDRKQPQSFMVEPEYIEGY